MLRLLTLLSLVIVLPGCSWVESKIPLTAAQKNMYLRAHAAPPLRLPENYPSDSVGDDYPIPPVAQTGYPTPPKSILPPGSLADQIAKGQVSANVLKTQTKKK